MTARMWKIAAIVTALGACLLFVSRPVGAGFLLGAVTAVVLFKRNEKFWNGVLDSMHSEKTTGLLHFIVNYVLMAGVLVLSALYPEILNIFACAVGLMLIKIAATIDALLKQEGG